MRTKSPTGILDAKITTIEKLAKRFTITESGCWEWNKPRPTGYGQFGVNGSTKGAHRVVWELCNGQETKTGNWSLDHLCRNRKCVNPEHLEQVSLGENSLRGNSMPAVNARKTHCKRGHELSGYNLLPNKRSDGIVYRGCRTCQREQSLESYHRRNQLTEDK